MFRIFLYFDICAFFSFACACLILCAINNLPTDYPEYNDYLSSLVDASIDENDVSTECSCYKCSYEVRDNDETASCNWNVNPEIHLPQLAEDVTDSSASKGFLGKKGDWFDAFALLSEFDGGVVLVFAAQLWCLTWGLLSIKNNNKLESECLLIFFWLGFTKPG